MREPTGTRRSTDVPRSGLARDRVQIDVPKIEKRSQNQTANERVLIGLRAGLLGEKRALALGSPLIFYLSAETPAGAPFCSAADPF